MGKKGKKSGKSRGKKNSSGLRRIARWLAVALVVVFVMLCLAGSWYARHSLKWLEESSWPRIVAAPLMYFGDRTLMLTDALGFTGHDAVYDSDEPVPEGQVLFAGRPVRVGNPAPADIKVLDRGEFVIGWSDSLRHPVWVAYHVPREARFEVGKRPSFKKDREVKTSPAAADYERTGYDRGHMAPNRAITSRFGPDFQASTFLMTNIAPQTPALNRGPWRELEQRIADLWTERWGEIWVICGAISSCGPESREMLNGKSVDVPVAYWMLITAQAEDGVRALALVLPQTVGYDDFPTHRIVTVDELERLTGLDLLPEMPSYLQNALEADLPTRLWPISVKDVFKLVMIRFP